MGPPLLPHGHAEPCFTPGKLRHVVPSCTVLGSGITAEPSAPIGCPWSPRENWGCVCVGGSGCAAATSVVLGCRREFVSPETPGPHGRNGVGGNRLSQGIFQEWPCCRAGAPAPLCGVELRGALGTMGWFYGCGVV